MNRLQRKSGEQDQDFADESSACAPVHRTIVGDFVKKGAYWRQQPTADDESKGMQTPMNLTAKLRARRAEARTRRAVNRAIDNAASSTMRHELIAMAQARQAHMR
ncbi:hypothetical protein [Amycolatopsis cihanbeyliensis]|nr:hypothetical protein [Amycolatopsis cihanbeyliensis]